MSDKDEILKAVEGLRQQQSAQHDEQLAILKHLREMTIWLKSRWEKFSRFGTWPGDSK